VVEARYVSVHKDYGRVAWWELVQTQMTIAACCWVHAISMELVQVQRAELVQVQHGGLFQNCIGLVSGFLHFCVY